MTPDQKFARWIKISCAAFLVMFAYFMLADLTMPLTPQALVTRVVTKVAPRVSGQVISINVKNNQSVHKGDVLFNIDPQPFQLAVEQAKINLDKVKQNNAQLDASIAAAEATVEANKVMTGQKVREAARLRKLLKRSGTSQQQYDDANSAAIAAKSNWDAAKARLQGLIVSRGSVDDEKNVNVRAARNQLNQAELNLAYTKVVAEHDGIVTNLQLKAGTFTPAGSPVIALVDDAVDIIADFREKSLRHFTSHSHAYVAFDRMPGDIYAADITSEDAGVSAGQFDANGRLATPSTSNRWVRDAQRMRLHLKLVDNVDKTMPAGAKATVQLVPDNGLGAFFAKLQIYFISILHYVY
ncbi:biotin/lipoyl-binding protein [Vibrio sp. CAIM 722]|uniref:Biotin/lipoyl-binding protein n=1 Tax=Vibrio eleionomae TaxID=2653505 RepID=A0A7X4RTS4_9VIBR|nr:HlyD family secretion protein [Vibrio eleionomae]MZI93141.1 biotin/lipoyl-binding protein [Vibrio eleionomae]